MLERNKKYLFIKDVRSEFYFTTRNLIQDVAHFFPRPFVVAFVLLLTIWRRKKILLKCLIVVVIVAVAVAISSF